MQYDVFLSYAVATESKLVNNIYWQLSSMEVMSNGKKRKLKIFWDRECLKTGENFENAFGSAICNCSLVVMFISRDLLLRLKKLEPGSPCDNVLLEHQIAVSLASIRNTSILPIFVGNRDPDPSKDYFDVFSDGTPDKGVESGWAIINDLPNTVVHSVSKARLSHLLANTGGENGELHASVNDPPSVLATYLEIKKLQGIFVSGPSYEGELCLTWSHGMCLHT